MLIEPLKQKIILRPAMAPLLALLLAGCSIFGPKPSQEAPASDPESVNAGYTLMYNFVATQKNSDKLLIIKRASPRVDRMIKEISDAAGKIDAGLKKFAKEDSSIQLDRRVLPLMEAKQRESAQAERALQFLGTSGKPFERLLLLTQSGVLTTQRHVARVMRDSETNPERKAFWDQTAKTFDRLYAKVVTLLEDQYFSP